MNCPHCETHIDEHEATRCLDAWIAEVVMGHSDIRKQEDSWEYCLYTGDCHEPYGVNCFFSTSISAAWLVVEKFGDGGFITIQGYLYDGRTNYWYVGKRGHIGSRAETFPLATCRAAIKVMGVNNDKT